MANVLKDEDWYSGSDYDSFGESDDDSDEYIPLPVKRPVVNVSRVMTHVLSDEDEATVGVVICNPNCAPMAAACRILEPCSLMYSSLMALKLVLEFAKERKCSKVELCSEMKDTIEFLYNVHDTGVSVFDDEEGVICGEILKLKEDFKYLAIRTIPQDSNKAASHVALTCRGIEIGPHPQILTPLIWDWEGYHKTCEHSEFNIGFQGQEEYYEPFAITYVATCVPIQDEVVERQSTPMFPFFVLRHQPGPIIYWLNIDGYIVEGETGNFGALLRDHKGNGIVAAVGTFEPVVSMLYHQLQGLKKGLKLAEEKEVVNVQVCCNSRRVVDIAMDRVILNEAAEKGSMFGVHNDLMVEVMTDIMELAARFAYFDIKFVGKPLNRAADCLAKSAHQLTSERNTIESMFPENFPKKLLTIIYEDANEGCRYYHSRNGHLIV